MIVYPNGMLIWYTMLVYKMVFGNIIKYNILYYNILYWNDNLLCYTILGKGNWNEMIVYCTEMLLY